MSTYAIGDIQGCYQALLCLLETCQFNRKQDRLWLVGDLVNRGPQSLQVLRLVHSLGDRASVVLGNHDLHLLAVAEGVRPAHPKDTLAELLAAPDRDELLAWLGKQPLFHHDPTLQFSMLHAGIAPSWSLAQAAQLAGEVEHALRHEQRRDYLAGMYGNTPTAWSDSLTGIARLRVITNYFTRMRICDRQGTLDLKFKGEPAQAPDAYRPWFEWREDKERIIFGHWASLQGRSTRANIFALDTGCVWGGQLTAIRLEDQQLFHCNCARP